MVKKKEEKKAGIDVYITYDESYVTTQDDGEQWGWREGYVEWSLGKAYLSAPKNTCYYECFELPVEKLPDKLYVVTVRYSTGDTFSRYDNKGCIEGVYLDRAEAEKVMQSIQDDTYKPGTYPSWRGFFERLESVDVEVLLL